MVQKVVPLCLFALLVLGACATPNPCAPPCEPCAEPCPPPCPAPCDPCSLPEPTRCGWPSVCGAGIPDDPDALQLLSGILSWANLTDMSPDHGIEEPHLVRLQCRVPECMLSTLADKDGHRVKDLDQVALCEQLRQIHMRAREAWELATTAPEGETPEQKAVRLADAKGRWGTVATDLDNFPAVPLGAPPGG